MARKLGIKEGYTIRLINAPDHYFQLFMDLPDNVHIAKSKTGKKVFIHFFTKELKELFKQLPKLKEELLPDGMIWVSWHKKASKVATDVTEDLIRNTALEIGLVDIKVCAIDDIWSGLKLVIPVKDRK